jgi:hypothetical protein
MAVLLALAAFGYWRFSRRGADHPTGAAKDGPVPALRRETP